VKTSRRGLLHAAAGAAAVSAFPGLSWALDYPAPDIGARLVAQSLSERFGQAFAVENRPGAGTNIGTETVVRAPPDGYTLLLITTPNMINASLYANLNFNFVRDIAPVGSIGENPFVMVVNPDFPAKSVGEFIAYAKTNPG
jgi:tripartite-type tricarboxylate transporter receptor subunit TctC